MSCLYSVLILYKESGTNIFVYDIKYIYTHYIISFTFAWLFYECDRSSLPPVTRSERINTVTRRKIPEPLICR